MGCGCKDKQNDALIIEYYNNKKTMEKNSDVTTEKKEYQGLLCDFSLYGIYEEDIIDITHVSENVWVATVQVKNDLTPE